MATTSLEERAQAAPVSPSLKKWLWRALIAVIAIIGLSRTISMVKEGSKAHSKAKEVASVCKDLSARGKRQCLVDTAGSNWAKAAEGVANDGMIPCFSPRSMVVMDYMMEEGTMYYRFRAKEGSVVVTYLLMDLHGQQCPQDIFL